MRDRSKVEVGAGEASPLPPLGSSIGKPLIGIMDRRAESTDIAYAVEAFRGLPYPFDGPDECP
ncbi:MAG: hypothetical protein WBE26_06705 [Phycisphaerae bacterium]